MFLVFRYYSAHAGAVIVHLLDVLAVLSGSHHSIILPMSPIIRYAYYHYHHTGTRY